MADEDARVPAEQLPADAGEVSAGHRPAPLAAVPPERSIASDPAGELPLVLPPGVSREPDAEPPFGGQADCRQVLTLIIRQPLRGLEVLGLLPQGTPAPFVPARNPSATSRPGPPLDRHMCGELTGGIAGETTYRPVMGDHAAVLADLDGVAALQTRAVEPSATHKHPLGCADVSRIRCCVLRFQASALSAVSNGMFRVNSLRLWRERPRGNRIAVAEAGCPTPIGVPRAGQARSRPSAVCCASVMPRRRGWAECATAGPHGQSGHGSVGSTTDHCADTERCHSTENDDSLLGPVLRDEVLPQDLVDLTQRLDWHLGDNLTSPVLPRTLGDLGDGGGAAPAEHDSHHDRSASLDLVDGDSVDFGDREREEGAQFKRREGLACRQCQCDSRADAGRGCGSSNRAEFPTQAVGSGAFSRTAPTCPGLEPLRSAPSTARSPSVPPRASSNRLKCGGGSPGRPA